MRHYFSITDRIGRFPALDGLRGIAILLVLLRHATQPIVEHHGTLLRIGSWDLATPLINGWMGVDLFFVLSGFLITYHLLMRWPSQFTGSFMARYWAKRVLRTFPAYFAAVFVALCGVIPLFEASSDNLSYTFFVHFLFLQDYLGSDLVAAFWSLGVEEKFYLLCPLVLLSIRRLTSRSQLIVLAALAVLPTVLRAVTLDSSYAEIINYPAFFWNVRSPFHLAMDGLWTGVICALIYANESLRGAIKKFNLHHVGNVCLALLFCLMIPIAWFDDGWYYSSTIVLALLAIAFSGLLLSSIVERTWITMMLSSAWLRAISTISYSVYLVHLMLVPLALHLVNRFVPIAADRPDLHFIAFAPLFIVLSVLAGLVLHFTVEKPFLILKDKIKF
jgi:peptidoglycan/LPS O-acetylase OafA/YrhL